MTRKTQKKLRKILTLVSCAVLLVCVTVVGTIAYLQQTTNIVTNTFTVGNVSFVDPKFGNALDEAKVNVYGEKVNSEGETKEEVTEGTWTEAGRVTENSYKLVPGHSYIKDPTVHMSKDTEDAWLFVKVDNVISGIEDSYTWADGKSGTIADQMKALGWTKIDNTTNVYYYKDTVSANADIPVFKGFAVKNDADVSTYENQKITIQAYAVQADGFDTAAAAWAAAPKPDWATTTGA